MDQVYGCGKNRYVLELIHDKYASAYLVPSNE